MLLSHEAGGIPSINMIQDNIAVCEAIKEGKTDNIPYEFMGRKAFSCFLNKVPRMNMDRSGEISFTIRIVLMNNHSETGDKKPWEKCLRSRSPSFQ